MCTATARREKCVVISRRVGGGKAAQKTQPKGGASRGIKLVDRRLKKDKRAMQRAQKNGKKGARKAKKAGGKKK